MKALIIAVFAISIPNPSFAEEASNSAFETIGPAAAAGAVTGLGVRSIQKDTKAIATHQKYLETSKNLLDEGKKAELAALEKERKEFVEKETKSANERWKAYEIASYEKSKFMSKAYSDFHKGEAGIEKAKEDFFKKHTRYPLVSDWKTDPELKAASAFLADAKKRMYQYPVEPRYEYARQYEIRQKAEWASERKFAELFKEKHKRILELRKHFDYAEYLVSDNEKKIEKLKLARRLKVGVMGLGAVAGAAYLAGESRTDAAVIDSMNFKGKRAPAVLVEREEKAELVLPAQ